jgi:hypothetical protein
MRLGAGEYKLKLRTIEANWNLKDDRSRQSMKPGPEKDAQILHDGEN